MMGRRAFVGGAVSVLAVPLAVEAQPTGRIYWIGDLREGPSRPPKPFADAMRELGWIEGSISNSRGATRTGETNFQPSRRNWCASRLTSS
jgi:hypothetical protein